MALDEEGRGLIEVPEGPAGSLQHPPTPFDLLRDYAEAVRGAFAPNTERAIRADTAIFTAWCPAAGLPSLPATPVDVARFVDEMSLTRRPATVRRYVSSVSHLHRAAELPNPALHSLVQLALRRMNRSQGREQRQAEAPTRRLVDRLLDAAGATIRDARNRALLAVAYDTLARRSELVAMQVRDVAIGAEGHGTVTIRRGKTDQEGRGSERYLAPDTSRLNGLIANDKFCLTRMVRLQLSWPRARVGPRVSDASQTPGEATHCGEAHETAARVAGPAQHRGSGHGPAALGPGLPASPAVGGLNPARADGGAGIPDPAGGTPCA